jgi:hypothetical protein
MALVSDKIIRSWYDASANTWVYRNFKHFFVNKFWHRQMPGGFSVCPMFWIAAFTFFLLRPFEFLIAGVIFPSVRTLFGKPIVTFDRWLQKKMGNDYSSFGHGLVPLLALLVVSGLVLLVAFLSIVIYIRQILPSRDAALGFWFGISWLALLVGVSRYQGRCQAHYWIPIWAIVTTAVCWSVNPGCVALFLSLAKEVVFAAFTFIVWLTCQAGHNLWLAAKWLWHWLAWLLTVGPSPMLPWSLIGFLLLTVPGTLFWVFERICPSLPDSQVSHLEDKATKEDWQSLVGVFFQENNDARVRLLSYLDLREYSSEVARPYVSPLLGSIFEPPACLLQISYGEFFKISRKAVRNRGSLEPWWYPIALATADNAELQEALYTSLKAADRAVRDCDFIDLMEEKIKPFVERLDEAQALRKEMLARKTARKDALRQNFAFLGTLCVKVTGAYAIIVKGLAFPFRLLWKLAKLTWKGVSNVWTAVAVLVKSRKQGVCPYYRFENQENGE